MRLNVQAPRISRLFSYGLFALATQVSALLDSGSPVLVAFLVDTSRSIRPQELALAPTLAGEVLRSLPAGSSMAVYSFDDRADLIVPRTSDPAVIERRLSSLAPGGSNTVLYKAIYVAANDLRLGSQAPKAIVVLTDGKDENSEATFDDAVGGAKEAEVPVFLVGVGSHIQRKLMSRLATRTGGAFLPIEQRSGKVLASLIEVTAAQRAISVARPSPERPPLAGAQMSQPASVAQTPAVAPTGSKRSPVIKGQGQVLPPLVWVLAGCLLAAAVGTLLFHRRSRGALGSIPTRPGEGGVEEPAAGSPLALRESAGFSTADPADGHETLRTGNVSSSLLDRTELIELGDASLTLREGTDGVQVFPVGRKGATVIGRGHLANVKLPDQTVSEEHCRIAAHRGFFLLQDLESTNGTFVNGDRVRQHVLRSGDVVRVGDTDLEFRAAP